MRHVRRASPRIDYLQFKFVRRDAQAFAYCKSSFIRIIVHQFPPETRSHPVHLQAYHLRPLLWRKRTKANHSGRPRTNQHHLPMTNNNCANDAMRIANTPAQNAERLDDYIIDTNMTVVNYYGQMELSYNVALYLLV